MDAALVTVPAARRVARTRLLAWFAAGAVVAALLLFLPAAFQLSGARRGPVRVWAADRDGHRVVGLDGDLIAVRELQAAWPLELEARADGGLWVLRSGNGTPSFGVRLMSLDAAGVLANQTWLAAGSTLELFEARDALVIENGGGAGGLDRVWRIEPDGRGTILAESSALTAVCASRGAVLLGAADGRLLRVDAAGSRRELARAATDASWGALAEGPRTGAFFALDVGPGHRLQLRRDDLQLAWSVALGFDARHFGVLPGEERVWVSDVNGARVRRYGPGGVLEVESVLALHAPDHALAFGDGALFAAPGAILRVDANGQPRPGQGGFAWLSDLARVP